MASRITLFVRRAACATLAFALTPALVPVLAQNHPQHWVATWSTANLTTDNTHARELFSSSHTPISFNHQTIRQIVHTTVGGKSVRVRLTNAFGPQPLTFDAVFAGLQKDGASLLSGSNHQVTFGGEKSVTIPEGAEALSDPVPLSVASKKNLVISLYIAGSTGPATVHGSAFQTNYLSEEGDFAADESTTKFTHSTGSWFFLAAVDVLTSQTTAAAIVALGDSITDGSSSQPNSYGRWTDVLARRLLSDHSQAPKSVLNAGIGGNRILTSSPCFGENALARLDRDVFSHAGIQDIILFEGTNDIGQPDTPPNSIPPQFVPCLSRTQITADDLIAGYKQIIAQAHARGLKIFGATILPYQGFGGWTSQGEDKRKAVNQWIRNARAFDGVIDFSATLSDPHDPTRLAPEYDSGDHLHPGQAGHKAMGEAIDLALFR